MSRSRVRFGAVAALLAGMIFAAAAAAPPRSAVLASNAGSPVAFSKPLVFEPNQGQTDPRVHFLARTGGGTLFLSGGDSILSIPVPPGRPASADRFARRRPVPAGRSNIRMSLLGGSPAPAMEGEAPLSSRSHYYRGADPSQWQTGVQNFARVRCRDVYPGVDLVYYGHERELEYDFVVAPRSDPGAIRLAFTGTDQVSLDAEGALCLQAGAVRLKQRPPVVYQEANGARRSVPASFRMAMNGAVGFELGEYDPSRPLVIDPVLEFSSHLGGNAEDEGRGITVDGRGRVYTTGWTASPNFPGRAPTSPSGLDAYVTCLSPGGQLIWSAFVGGSADDIGEEIAVDRLGNASIIGWTASGDFPTLRALQNTNQGGPRDACLAKLSASGSLIFSSYLGSPGEDLGYGIASDRFGSLYVTGQTAPGFPLVNAVQPTYGGGANDAFAAKIAFSATGQPSFSYATFLGGTDYQVGIDVAVDTAGNAYYVGSTNGAFPTVNPFQPNHAGGPEDAYLAKLNSAGSALLYSTYLGGGSSDYVYGVAVDLEGSAYVAGHTHSSDFPLQNPIPKAFDGGEAFLTKVNPAGSALVYSTYLGGGSDDRALGVTVDLAGRATLIGETPSQNVPMVNPIQAVHGGPAFGLDAFVIRLNAQGSAYDFSTYLGGGADDRGQDITSDPLGNLYLAGYTFSGNFPQVAPVQPAPGGAKDAFVARFGGPLFDISIQDDRNRGDILLLNSATGDYLVQCKGQILLGRGQVSRHGRNIVELKHQTRGLSLLIATVVGDVGFATVRKPRGWSCRMFDRSRRDNDLSYLQP